MLDTLILSGGATRGYYQLGCLYRYKEHLGTVKRYIGCSVGGIICTLLCAGYDIGTIYRHASNTEVPKIMESDVSTWISHMKMFIDRHGILDENPYVTSATQLIKKRYGKIPTLLEFRQITGKELVLVGSCISTYVCSYLSADTFPEMPLSLAIDITSRIPILFTPILYDGYLYVDGGVQDHFPISQAKDMEKTLAIYTCGKVSSKINSLSEISPMRYLWMLTHASTKGKYIGVKSTDHLYVHIIRGKGGSLSVSKDQALFMFLIGFINRMISSK